MKPTEHNDDKLKDLTLEDWQEQNLPTLACPEAFIERIAFLQACLDRDAMLPKSLRSDITGYCNKLTSAFEQDRLSFQFASSIAEQLDRTCCQWKQPTVISSTLCQIRTLDMEINPHRYGSRPELHFAFFADEQILMNELAAS